MTVAPSDTPASVLPPGRTAAEQRVINAQALDECAPELRDDCLAQMGYVRFEPTRLRPASEKQLEGNIIAAIAVILGLLWLVVRVWAWLFASRSAYRYITKPRE